MMVLFISSEAAAHAADAAEQAGGMPQMDFATYPSQIFWLAIAFVLLYLALDRVLIPRIGGAIEERKDRIADDLDMAARKKIEADGVRDAYHLGLERERARASAIIAENRAELDAGLADQAAAQEVALDKDMAKAEAMIAKARADAMTHVEEIALHVADKLVSTLGGPALEPKALQKALQVARSGDVS